MHKRIHLFLLPLFSIAVSLLFFTCGDNNPSGPSSALPQLRTPDVYKTGVDEPVTLRIEGSDPDGEIAEYQWTIDSAGPVTTQDSLYEVVYSTDGLKQVKVQAVDNEGNYSNAVTINIAVVANASVLIWPLDGDSIPAGNAYLEWVPGSYSQYFSVFMDTTNPPVVNAKPLTYDSSYNVTSYVEPGKTYYWYVIAHSETYEADTSEIASFTVAADDSMALEFEFCRLVLSDYSIYQDKLPPDPSVYFPNCANLYASIGDPYTAYIDPVISAMYWSAMTTETAGVGILHDSTLSGYAITYVIKNSPAENAGLQVGDTITAVGDSSTAGISYSEFKALLTGEPGEIRVLHLRNESGERTVEVTLGTFFAPSVFTVSLSDSVAYIVLERFSSETEIDGGSAEEFRRALDSTKWARYTIFDLRQNGGGELGQCFDIASNFVPDNTPVIKSSQRSYVESLNGVITHDTTYYSEGGEKALDRPFYVLVDGYTASASEIVVSCLKDFRPDDITVIGTTTYGKGSGQYLFNTPTEGIAKITRMLLMPVLGSPYNLVGIAPHVEITPDEDALDVALEMIGTTTLAKARKNNTTRRIEILREQLKTGEWAPVGVIKGDRKGKG
ncbi:MAG: PDZ domain-containing protein [Chitinivibrionales bacterium]|nr:PDZ domain-containing protein [Chitinivibrionales bacterium]